MIQSVHIYFFFVRKVCQVYYNKKEDRGELYGIGNGRIGPPISHLRFADDNIFFARSDNMSVDALKDTLKIIVMAPGRN